MYKCSNKKCKKYNCTFSDKTNCEVYFDITKCKESKQRKRKILKCPKCELIMELYDSAEKTKRNYWIVTELFFYMHNKKDYCNYKNKKEKKDEQETRRET